MTLKKPSFQIFQYICVNCKQIFILKNWLKNARLRAGYKIKYCSNLCKAQGRKREY